MKKLKVMTVVGTRPEIIRLSAVINKLESSDAIDHTLVHTGQNYDYELNEVFFKDFNLRKPDYFLNAAKGTAVETVGNILINIDLIEEKKNQFQLSQKKIIYTLFFLFTIIMLLLFPEAIGKISFIIPNETALSSELELSFLETLSTFSLNVSKQLIFILLFSFFHKKYKISDRRVWIWLSLFVMFLNISVYIGTNRSDFLMVGIASAFLFYKVYPQYSKILIIVLIITISIIIPAITSLRQMTNLTDGDSFLFNLSTMIQQYLGSPYNVAIAIEAAELFPEKRNLINLLYDLVRPVLGLNLLVSRAPLELSTVYFNYRIYLRFGHATQIIPMIGQGYFFFGFLMSPLLSVFFIKMGDFCEKKLKNINQIEIFYFLSITTTRLAFSLGQNATIQLNDLSFTLFIPLLLIWLNNKVVLKKSDYMMN